MHVGLNLDYNICPFDRPEIDAFLARCASVGVRRVLWRLSVCGKVAYPSRVREPVEHSGAHERLKEFDPLRYGLDAGARAGVEVVPWITLLDEAFDWANITSRVVRAHPEWQLQDRAGEPFPGVLCYAVPEVRALRLAETSEVLAYGPPALYLCTRSHAAHNLPRPRPPPDSHGTHPLLEAESPGAPPGQLARAHGRHLTTFLAEVRGRAGATRLLAGIRLRPLAAMNVYPWARLARFWRGWTAGGLVDELVLAAGDDLLDQPPERTRREVSAYLAELGSRPVTVWVRLWDWRRGEAETDPVPTWPQERVLERARLLRDAGVGQVTLHEAKNVIEKDLWGMVEALARL